MPTHAFGSLRSTPFDHWTLQWFIGLSNGRGCFTMFFGQGCFGPQGLASFGGFGFLGMNISWMMFHAGLSVKCDELHEM